MVRALDSNFPTRPFAVGSFTFLVATSTDEERMLVEEVFADLPSPRAPHDPAQFVLLRTSARAWSMSGPRVTPCAMVPLDGALKQLVTAVNLGALDAEPEHLHLHAAAATRAGRAVVIAAERNTGKTTTVAHLVARGWAFVTDETVRLSATTERITGFPKPLSVKPGGEGRLDMFRRWMIPTIESDAALYRFVPVGATGASLVDGGVPHLVVLLRRPDDMASNPAPVALRLHPADAVVALMQETLDAERFGATPARLARLAAASHCYMLTMGSPTETAEQIEALVEQDPVTAIAVSQYPSSDAFSPGVVTMKIGRRAVIHDPTSGLIVALDEGATRVWNTIGGHEPADGIDLDGPVIASFVDQLHGLGVLAAQR